MLRFIGKCVALMLTTVVMTEYVMFVNGGNTIYTTYFANRK